MNRFHLIIEGARTTVTLDPVLSNLLAVKLSTDPFQDKKAARLAVRTWLQAVIDVDPGAFVRAHGHGTNRNSQRLQKFALRAVAAPNLLRRLDDLECKGLE